MKKKNQYDKLEHLLEAEELIEILSKFQFICPRFLGNGTGINRFLG